ncbi:MAG: 30S ribosomal protein S4, partial [bacterium]|nr:30S ribosomal protein S4 [bacterium]
GDKVEVSEKSRQVQPIRQSLEGLERRGLPAWLEIDKEKFAGVVRAYPTREELTVPMQEQLVVELYSK